MSRGIPPFHLRQSYLNHLGNDRGTFMPIIWHELKSCIIHKILILTMNNYVAMDWVRSNIHIKVKFLMLEPQLIHCPTWDWTVSGGGWKKLSHRYYFTKQIYNYIQIQDEANMFILYNYWADYTAQQTLRNLHTSKYFKRQTI